MKKKIVAIILSAVMATVPCIPMFCQTSVYASEKTTDEYIDDFIETYAQGFEEALDEGNVYFEKTGDTITITLCREYDTKLFAAASGSEDEDVATEMDSLQNVAKMIYAVIQSDGRDDVHTDLVIANFENKSEIFLEYLDGELVYCSFDQENTKPKEANVVLTQSDDYAKLQQKYDDLLDEYDKLKKKYKKLKKKYDSIAQSETEDDVSEPEPGQTSEAPTEQPEENEDIDSHSGEDYYISNVYFKMFQSEYSGDVGYDAVVTVHNSSDHALYLSNCSFDLEDSSGHLVNTEDMIIHYPDIVLPGEDGYFYSNFGTINVPGASMSEEYSLKVYPEIEKSKKTDPEYFEASDISISDDYLKRPNVTGRVTNTTDEEEGYYYIHVLFFDENDHCIGITGTSITDLRPGVPKSFEVSSLCGTKDVVNWNFSRYEIGTQTDYYQW